MMKYSINMKRIFTGLVIIAAGLIVLLANIDMYNMREILQEWWPLGLIVLGLLMLLNNTRQFVWPLVFIGLGSVMLLNSVGVASINFGDIILPVILVGVGVSVMLGARGMRSVSARADNRDEVLAIMSGVSQKISSDDLTQLGATSILGGIELDLSKVKIKKDATINALVLMGGLEIRVPEDVVVRPRALVMLGGIEDKTQPAATKNAPILYIDGTVLMGGVEVKR